MSRARRVDANPRVEPSSVLLTPGQQLQVPVAGRESAGVGVPRAPVSPRPPEGVELTLVDGRGARGLVPLTVLREGRLGIGKKSRKYVSEGGLKECDWKPILKRLCQLQKGETIITGELPGEVSGYTWGS